jgi:carbonic anhydrase/acetyltransferase-like protein (isoleucine patch superfamily)
MKYQLADQKMTTDGTDHWIAPSADLIGRVNLANDVSIWWQAVLRADNEPITIGERTNIQDGCVIHTDPGYPVNIGKNVSVGHMCMLHGCEIGDGSLIGIGSIVLNGAKIGNNCLIGANSLIVEGKEIPDNSLVMGSPGKVVKDVSEEQIETLLRNADGYVKRWRRYRDELEIDD